jgi:hypothetical protein
MKAVSRKRIGSVPGCLFLQAHDVGEAVLEDGRTVTITWGGNFRGRQDFTGLFQPDLVQIHDVWEGNERRDNYEMLIPEAIASKIRPTLIA